MMREVHVYRVQDKVFHIAASSGYIDYFGSSQAPKLALGYTGGAGEVPGEVVYEFKTEKLPIWKFVIPGDGEVYAAIDPKLLDLVELSVKAKYESQIELARTNERAEAKKVCDARIDELIAEFDEKAAIERVLANETSQELHRIGMRDGAVLASCVIAIFASVAIFFGVIDFNLGIW